MRARPAHRSSKTRPRSWGHCYAGNDKAVRREVGDARSHVNRAQIECGFDCLGLPPHARGTVARPQGPRLPYEEVQRAASDSGRPLPLSGLSAPTFGTFVREFSPHATRTAPGHRLGSGPRFRPCTPTIARSDPSGRRSAHLSRSPWQPVSTPLSGGRFSARTHLAGHNRLGDRSRIPNSPRIGMQARTRSMAPRIRRLSLSIPETRPAWEARPIPGDQHRQHAGPSTLIPGCWAHR